MTTRFYLDTRGSAQGAAAPIKLSISSKGKTTFCPTGISVLPSQWDSLTQRITAHPKKSELNLILSRKKYELDNVLIRLKESGRLHGLTASEIREAAESELVPVTSRNLILPRIIAYAERQDKEATRYTYNHTADKIRAFDKNAERLTFDDITPQWLERFNRWMALSAPSQNARNIILRNIRAVFNEAIDEKLTAEYPFRRYKVRPAPTRSRALTLEQTRALFSHDGEYSDMFRLTFYLGGISFCDLCALTRANIRGGRIEYRRQKTGQFCSVGIQPEAQSLLDKYAGTEHLLFVADKYEKYTTYLHALDCGLKRIGDQYDTHAKKWRGTAICGQLSIYWARYTVATLAAEIGTSEGAISAILGHAQNKSVTSIYIRANRNRQVDDAIRGVIDLVNGKVNGY